MNLDLVEVADCRAWLAKLPEDSIDLLMTSPPYWSPRSYSTTLKSIWGGGGNVDCEYEWSSQGSCANCRAWKGELGLEPTQKMYVAHLLDVFRLVKRVLKPTGSFYFNLGDTFASTQRRRSGDDRGIPRRIRQGMLNNGWVLVDKSIWRKPNLISSDQGSGPKYSYELLFHFVKNRKTLLWHNVETQEWIGKKPIQRYRNLKTDVGTKWDKLGTTLPLIMKAPIEDMPHQNLEERRLWRQVWQPFAYYYDLDAISGLQQYTTPVRVGVAQKGRIEGPQFEVFPEEFCIRPILSSCPPEGIVADPFAGSGTTLFVAKKLGRHYLGCDLNSDYVKIARKRLAAVERPLTYRKRKRNPSTISERGFLSGEYRMREVRLCPRRPLLYPHSLETHRRC